MGRSSTRGMGVSPLPAPRRGLLLLLLATAATTTSIVARAEEVALPAWMGRAAEAAAALGDTSGVGEEGALDPEAFAAWREGVLRDVLVWGEEELPPPTAHEPTAHEPTAHEKQAYPYFAFLPNLQGRLNTTDVAPNVTITAASPYGAHRCFGHTTLHYIPLGPRHGEVVVHAADPVSTHCSDLLLLATAGHFHFQRLAAPGGRHVFPWTLPAEASEAELWDQATKGIRVFSFATKGVLGTLHSVLETARLFEPVLTQDVAPDAAARNAEFLRDYAGYDFQLLNASSTASPLSPLLRTARRRLGSPSPFLPHAWAHVPPTLSPAPEESEVRNGDMFGILRMDGLDPMLAWGMGATTGHVVTALWIEGELFIVESQIQSSYWPQGNVQRTPYRTWLAWAEAAGYNVLYIPLNDAAAARYDPQAALAWFEGVEGLAYGYHSMLWGWVDTPRDNYPCLPPDYGRCLEWEFLEVAFALLDKHIPAVAKLLWSEAFNLRVGTQGQTTAEVWMTAERTLDIPAQRVPTLPEQDAWAYHTWKGTADGGRARAVGRSMVCCVFVCGMWKAAGVFGPGVDPASINCGELTNADDVMLAFFDGGRTRQIFGAYRMFLPAFNFKGPFPHMDERCPSLAPGYARPADC